MVFFVFEEFLKMFLDFFEILFINWFFCKVFWKIWFNFLDLMKDDRYFNVLSLVVMDVFKDWFFVRLLYVFLILFRIFLLDLKFLLILFVFISGIFFVFE